MFFIEVAEADCAICYDLKGVSPLGGEFRGVFNQSERSVCRELEDRTVGSGTFHSLNNQALLRQRASADVSRSALLGNSI